MTRKEIKRLSDEYIDNNVRIEGTDYDRKRVVTSKVKQKIEKMQLKGKDIGYISNKLKISPKAIRYNTDPDFRKRCIAQAGGKHTGIDYFTPENRASYKRRLLLRNKLEIN